MSNRSEDEIKHLLDRLYVLVNNYSDSGHHNALLYLSTACESLEALMELQEMGDEYLER